MPVVAITSKEEFKNIIDSGRSVVIDFWAPWCGPCRAISPIFEQIVTKYEQGAEKGHEGVGFYKVNIDDCQDIAQEVGIRTIPAFILFKQGTKVDEFVGGYPEKLEKLVKAASGDPE